MRRQRFADRRQQLINGKPGFLHPHKDTAAPAGASPPVAHAGGMATSSPTSNAAMALIDIGLNLTHDSFDHDRDQVWQRARDAGVVQAVLTGARREHSP